MATNLLKYLKNFGIILLIILIIANIIHPFFQYKTTIEEINCSELLLYHTTADANSTCKYFKRGPINKGIHVTLGDDNYIIVSDQFYDFFSNKIKNYDDEWIEEINGNSYKLTIKYIIVYSWDGKDEPSNNLIDIYPFYYLKINNTYISGKFPVFNHFIDINDKNMDKYKEQIKKTILDYINSNEIFKLNRESS